MVSPAVSAEASPKLFLVRMADLPEIVSDYLARKHGGPVELNSIYIQFGGEAVTEKKEAVNPQHGLSVDDLKPEAGKKFGADFLAVMARKSRQGLRPGNRTTYFLPNEQALAIARQITGRPILSFKWLKLFVQTHRRSGGLSFLWPCRTGKARGYRVAVAEVGDVECKNF